jgi:short-subunit dehydrogenase
VRLSGRVIAITGASSGIGRAAAIAAAREGAAVGLLARRADRLAALEREIAAATGGAATAVTGDVTIDSDLDRFVRTMQDRHGRLDVMVCNAGIGYHGTLDDTPPEVMRRLVDVNILGTMYAARAALAVFRRQGAGHIIAVSSMAGRRGIGGSSVYSATKAAQIGLVEGLRAEFAGTPFQASLVYPVAVDTEFKDAIHRDYGRRVEGHGPRQSVDEAARMIVDCIVTPRAEVYPFASARWFAVLNVLAPARTDRLTQRFGRRVVPPPTDAGAS